jgi:hypothetical protein
LNFADRFYSVGEFADLTGYHPDSIYRAIARGACAFDAGPDASRAQAGPSVDDTLLTLDQARAALLGDAAAERSNAWPSIKTLRRAYASGELAVVQRVAGGRVMVWRSELLRWASTPRAAPKQSPEATARGSARPRKPVRRQPAGPSSKRPVSPSAGHERKSAPPRLSLDDLKAA